MNRRSLLLGSAALIAAPAIVRADSLMKIAAPKPMVMLQDWLPCDGRIISRKLYPELFAAIGGVFGEGRVPDLRMGAGPDFISSPIPPHSHSINRSMAAKIATRSMGGGVVSPGQVMWFLE